MKRGKSRKESKKIINKKKVKLNWKILILSSAVVLLTALMGSLFTSQGVRTEWYNSIKPDITPPSWVFSSVWTILFCFITASLYLSLTSAKKKVVTIKIYTLFGFNLLLNILWTLFYFSFRSPVMAYFDLIMLLASIAMLISFTWKINRKAAWLLVPYFLWVSFAGILNYLSAFA